MAVQDEGPRRVSGWAVAGLSFAATIMILVGIFQAISGLAAIIEDDFLVLTEDYAYHVDATAWGWIHLILGIIVAFAGFALISQKPWARLFAIALAVMSAIANFFYIPYYPFWSILMIALAVWVIWSLTKTGGAASEGPQA
jgi:hypothetical protein